MGNSDRSALDQEFERIQRKWRRKTALQAGAVTVALTLVIVTAHWLGLDLAYLYAHRSNLIEVLFAEMLAPQALWAQLQGEGPDLAVAAVETLAIAGVGTALALPVALIFGILAAANVSPSVVNTSVRFLLGGMRAIPSIVYALLFVILAGLGPVAGVLAVAMGTVGDLGRLFADEMEEIDEAPVEAVRSAGAGTIATTTAARLPQVATAYVAWTLFYLEINARKSSALGIVGAGGLGYPLIIAFRARNYTRVMTVILAVLVLVVGVETTANRLRDMLDNKRRTSK